MQPEEKEQIKIIKEAVEFIGITPKTVTVNIVFNTANPPKCFWTLEFLWLEKETKVEGSYFILDKFKSRAAIIMALGIALYLKKKEDN